MTDMQEAVDDLTAPRNVKVETDTGNTWASEDALLVQLEQAVSSTLNSGSGSGGAAWERNVLDSNAMYTAAIIRAAIGDWCRGVGIMGRRSAIDGLRAWWAHRQSVNADERAASDAFYLGQLRKWADQIRSMVNPPKVIEIVAPCPVCGQGTFTNEQGEIIRNPLQLTYRPNSGSIWADAKAVCRACSEVWDNEWRLRGLRHDIDAKESA